MSVLLFLFWLAAAGVLLYAVCSNLLFWYESLNGRPEALPCPRPSIPVILSVYFQTVGGYVLDICVTPLGWVQRRKVSPLTVEPGLARPPLILVHGVLDNAGAWTYLGRRLEKEGYRVSTWSYRSFRATPEELVARLDDHVHMVEATYPGVRPVFVCHSLGGLLVRLWLRDPANQRRAGGVLTLGTPHQGSKVAVLAPCGMARRLRPDAPFILSLAQDGPPEHPVPCVSLVTPTDEAVLPAASLLPPAGWKLRVLHRLSHFTMLFCPRAARVVLEELQELCPCRKEQENAAFSLDVVWPEAPRAAASGPADAPTAATDDDPVERTA